MSLALPTECHVTPGLRLEHQLCFRLYASSRLITRLYQPLLEPLGLTYPQYIVLMILWEHEPCRATDIGTRAYLQSNTLTPLLRRLEEQGLIVRERSALDERSLNISLTEKGRALEFRCTGMSEALLQGPSLDLSQFDQLRRQLDVVLNTLSKPG